MQNRIVKFIAYQVSGIFPFLYNVYPLVKSFNFIKAPYTFTSNYIRYIRKNKKANTPFRQQLLRTRPIMYDRYEEAGEIPRHYFYQDIWAAKKVFASGTSVHYDIGSRINGFISHCVVFTKVIMLDIRPLAIKLDNLEFLQTDATNMVNIATNSIQSLSSLHAVEHFGLGRYGDPIDPEGYVKTINEMTRILKPGGFLLFSVPVGKQALEFNAHRIFDPVFVRKLFSKLSLIEFSYIDDNENMHLNVNPSEASSLNYGCGLYHFRKENNEV